MESRHQPPDLWPLFPPFKDSPKASPVQLRDREHFVEYLDELVGLTQFMKLYAKKVPLE